MHQDFLTLEEAARYLRKSTQTLRRMIKKGLLKAQRIKTPQGFHYLVRREDLLFHPPIQKPSPAFIKEEKPVLTSQNASLSRPHEILLSNKPFPPPSFTPSSSSSPTVFKFPPLPPSSPIEWKDFLKFLDRQHREHMALLAIIEKLQKELFFERQRALEKPKTLWQRLKRFWREN